MTLSISDIQCNNALPLCSECHVLFMNLLKAIMLSVVIVNVVMLGVIILSVVAPYFGNDGFYQRTLTEGEASVRLTSLY